jgi:hypothetical protein
MKAIKIVPDEKNVRKHNMYVEEEGGDVLLEAISQELISPAGKCTGKLIISKNFIAVLQPGMKITDITEKYPRKFYNLFVTEDNTLVIAEDLEDATETVSSGELAEIAEEESGAEEVVTVEEGEEAVLAKVTAGGVSKKRLSSRDKMAYLEKFKKEVALDMEFRSCKKIKDKAIFLLEAQYPVSAVAYILERKFQQIRQYAVEFYGRNLRKL